MSANKIRMVNFSTQGLVADDLGQCLHPDWMSLLRFSHFPRFSPLYSIFLAAQSVKTCH